MTNRQAPELGDEQLFSLWDAEWGNHLGEAAKAMAFAKAAIAADRALHPAAVTEHDPSPAPTDVASPKPQTQFCWLVELFMPGGNSMGYYHTGFTTLNPGESRTTRDPLQAKRYANQANAASVADRLLHLQGVWRAVEHGFDA